MKSKEEILQLAIEQGLVPRGTTLEQAKQISRNYLAQKKASQQSQETEEQKPGFFQERLSALEQSNPVQAVLGAGNAVANTMTDVANLIPGVNLPHIKSGEGTAYNVGNILGNLGAFVGGGEILEGLPVAGKIAKILGSKGVGGVAKRALGTSIYGGITNPEDRATGALEGGLTSIALDALIPGLGKGFKKIKSITNPQADADNILEAISGGKTIKENAKSAAKDIIDLYRKTSGGMESEYNNLLDSYGNRNLFNNLNPFEKKPFGGKTAESAFKNAEEDFGGKFSSGLKESVDEFKSNPTFSKAHDLNSKFKEQIRDLEYKKKVGTITDEQQFKLDKYKNLKNSLEKDIHSFFEASAPKAGTLYQNITNRYAKEMVPHKKVMEKLANELGKDSYLARNLTNPKFEFTEEHLNEIANVLKSPGEKLKKSISKIQDRLSPETKNAFLHAKIAKNPHNLTPEKILDSLKKLEEDKFFENFISPKIQEKAASLESKIKRADVLQRAHGLVGGALGGSHFGPVGSVIGGGLGALLGPMALKTSGKGYNSKALEAIKDALSRTYSPVTSKAIKANLIPSNKRKKLLELQLNRYAGVQPEEEF